MMTRRIFESVVIMVTLWDIGKGAVRLWQRKTWASTAPGTLPHDIADLSSIFV